MRALGQARIALSLMSPKAAAIVQQVPRRLLDDEGLTFERARWRRRRNDDKGALELIDSVRKPTHPEKWWLELSVLARRAMERHDFKAAYDIVSRHRLESATSQWAEAEWMRGWLALRFLDKPAEAYQRFDTMYRNVKTAISRSRASYWAGRAAEAEGRGDIAIQWYRLSAVFTSTYYGQISAMKLKLPMKPDAFAPTREASESFDKNELVRAALLLDKTGLSRLTDPFLAKLMGAAKTRDDFMLVAKLAEKMGRVHYAVMANKECQQRLGLDLPGTGYPVLAFDPPPSPEKALIHAIAYRESMFKADAVSPVGALGLMQLMPATAKSMSKRKKHRYAKSMLTEDPQYNVKIGAAYLQDLIGSYNGSLPLAVAAYNAGPGNVRDWMNKFGNPIDSTTDFVDWVELVPNYETRNYIQRVLETYGMYRLKFGLPPAPIR
jgi:soluble lytic murein transglycosylase